MDVFRLSSYVAPSLLLVVLFSRWVWPCVVWMYVHHWRIHHSDFRGERKREREKKYSIRFHSPTLNMQATSFHFSSTVAFFLLVLIVGVAECGQPAAVVSLAELRRRAMSRKLNKSEDASATSFVGLVDLSPSFLQQIAGAITNAIPTYSLSSLSGGGWSQGGGCGAYVAFDSWSVSSPAASNVVVTSLSSSSAATSGEGSIAITSDISFVVDVNGMNGYQEHSSCRWCSCWLCGSTCDTDYTCGGFTATADVTASLSFALTISATGTVSLASVNLPSLNVNLNAQTCGGLCGGSCQGVIQSSIQGQLTQSTRYSTSVVQAVSSMILAVSYGVTSVATTDTDVLIAANGASTSLPGCNAFPYASTFSWTPSFATVQLMGTTPITSSCEDVVCSPENVFVESPVNAQLSFANCGECVTSVDGASYFALFVNAQL